MNQNAIKCQEKNRQYMYKYTLLLRAPFIHILKQKWIKKCKENAEVNKVVKINSEIINTCLL